MATDYDAPRKTDDDHAEDSIEELKSRRVDKSSSSVDVDETDDPRGTKRPGDVDHPLARPAFRRVELDAHDPLA